MLQLNVQKRKDPTGNVIVLPASLFYYPQGNIHSPNSFAFAGSGYYPGGGGIGHGPSNALFDEVKPLESPSSLASSATTDVWQMLISINLMR